MQILRTILLILLIYFGIRVLMRLVNAVSGSSSGGKKGQGQNPTQSNKKKKKPNYGNTQIEDADYEEIK